MATRNNLTDLSNQVFYVDDFDINTNAIPASLSGSQLELPDFSATVVVDVSLSLIQNLFLFSTDSIDVSDNNFMATVDSSFEDVRYKLNYSQNDNTAKNTFGVCLDTNATVISGAIYDSPNTVNVVTYDWERYLAYKIFNTHLGVDLFNNEYDLRVDLSNNFANAFSANLYEIATRDDPPNYVNGIAGGGNDLQTYHPARGILRQIIQNDPDRLVDVNDLSINQIDAFQDIPDPAEGNWFKVPIKAGDTICFLLTIVPHVNQYQILHSTSNNDNISSNDNISLTERKYLVKMNITQG